MTRPSPLGAHIRACRKQRGWSMLEFARRAAVGYPCLSRLETGRSAPSAAQLRRILDALGVTSEQERAGWHVTVGVLPGELVEALLAHPERWGEVRAMLTGRPPAERDAHTALCIVAMEYLDAEAARDATQTARAEAAVYGTPDDVRDAERAHSAAVRRAVVARKALRALTSTEAIGTGRG